MELKFYHWGGKMWDICYEDGDFIVRSIGLSSDFETAMNQATKWLVENIEELTDKNISLSVE